VAIHLTVGLTIFRAIVGLLIIGHGTQKAFGWFNGPGLSTIAKAFHGWGFVPGRLMGAIAASCEIGSGTLILAGLATPLAAAILIGTMAVAAAPNFRNGFWAAKGGIELAFIYGVFGVVLAFTGPGQLSVDHVIGTPSGVGAGMFSVLLGSLAAAVVLWSRASTLAQRKARSE
jgi:putative oxidoreductase